MIFAKLDIRESTRMKPYDSPLTSNPPILPTTSTSKDAAISFLPPFPSTYITLLINLPLYPSESEQLQLTHASPQHLSTNDTIVRSTATARRNEGPELKGKRAKRFGKRETLTCEDRPVRGPPPTAAATGGSPICGVGEAQHAAASERASERTACGG